MFSFNLPLLLLMVYFRSGPVSGLEVFRPDSNEAGTNAINYGSHIFLGSNSFAIESSLGNSLLGHELVHGLQTKCPHSVFTPALRLDQDTSAEKEADDISQQLVNTDTSTIPVHHTNLQPAFRGDKRIRFSGQSITVSDTYVLYGDGVSPAFIQRFRQSLDRYYNRPNFNYRGYNVRFNLSVRAARYRQVQVMDPSSPVGTVRERVDSPFDPDTMLFEVQTGSGSAGGIFIITLYETSTESTIAHEAGHYLTDRIGYFSEGYTEGISSRLGITGRSAQIRPEARGDIMGTLSGTVGTFSLSGILDRAINVHESSLRPPPTQVERLRQQQWIRYHRR